MWRYVGLREVSRILLATLAATLILLGFRASMTWWLVELSQHAVLPYGVIAINFTLSFLGVAGVRAGRRLSSEKSKADSRRKRGIDSVPTLLIGAGQGGLIVAKEIDGRAYGSTAASLVALGPDEVRYDFTATPAEPAWTSVDTDSGAA